MTRLYLKLNYTDETLTKTQRNIAKMTDGLTIIQFDVSEQLKEDGSNWIFWKTQIVAYLKGSGLWAYASGNVPRHRDTKTTKLIRWEEIDAQALTTILMNISPNVQAGLDCSSTQTAWDSLMGRYAQANPWCYE